MSDDVIRFVVPGDPVAKGRPRFVRATGRTYTPEKTARYENFVGICYMEQVGKPPIQAGFPLRMTINIFQQIPKSASKKKREQMLQGIVRPTKKPDVTNISKSIEDGCNKIAYADDSQIVEMQVLKYYSDIPRVEVEIQEAAL